MKKIILLSLLISLLSGCSTFLNLQDDQDEIEENNEDILNQGPQAIYDKNGSHIGWIIFDKHIYNSNASIKLSTLQNTMVHTNDGIFVGFFENGYFRDKKGDAVAFISGAVGGPDIPRFSKPVLPSLPPLPPLTPLKPLQPIISYTLFWSEKSWDEFVTGQ